MGSSTDKQHTLLGNTGTPDLFSVEEHPSKTLLVTKNSSEKIGEILNAMDQNPSIVEELHNALMVIQKDKADNIPYPRIRNFARHRVPLCDISTDIKNFQNRRKPYSEHSAQGIVDAVKT